MDSKEIFTSALGLQSPWSVIRAEFQINESGTKELHLWLAFEKGFLFTAPDGSQSTAYDTLDKTWRHLNFFQHHCYIHCKVPRIRYGENKIAMVSVPWARPHSGFTLLFEAYSMLLIEEEMPVSSVSEVTQVTAPRIWRVFKYWVNEAYERSDWSNVRRIGVDETSRRKGHCYITQFVDLDAHRTLFAVEGKDSETFGAFKTELQRKGGDPEKIKLISMDMSPAFISGRDEYFPRLRSFLISFTWYSTSIKLWTKFEKQSIRTAICLNASDTLSLETAQNLAKRNYVNWTRCLSLTLTSERPMVYVKDLWIHI